MSALADTGPDDEDAIVAALSQWRQGDFVLGVGDLPLLTTPHPDDEDDTGVVLETHPGFVVLSQSCDLVRPPRLVPAVAMCPLAEATPEQIARIEKGEAPALGLVQGAPNGLVANFTKTMSVDKSLLVQWERQCGFTDEIAAREFARAIERCFGRFAFPDAFNQSLSKFRSQIIGKYKRAGSSLGKALRSIHEIRVKPSGTWTGDRVKITFIVLFRRSERRETPLAEIAEEIETLIDAIEWVAPFEIDPVVPIKTGTYDDLTARDYAESQPLDLNAMSFAARYRSDA